MRWGVVLCSCNETLRFDPKRIGRYLGLEAAPTLFARLPRDEMRSLVDLLKRERFDRVAIGCCGPAELFREAIGAAGATPVQSLVVNLKEQCFWPHPPGEEAEAKAARLLRASMRCAEAAPPVPELPVKVGGTVLIATDSAMGLHLARRLADVARPVLVLDERAAAFDGEFAHPLPWKANWGRVAAVEGSVGDFRVTIERTQPLSLEACIYCRRCIPVCHTSAISDGLRLRQELCDQCGDCLKACEHVGAIRIPRRETETIGADQVVLITQNGSLDIQPRTGCHVLRSPGQGDVDGVAWKVLSLLGEFRKPQYVIYDAGTCAGGSADRQSCGLCIEVCPYRAISRNPKNPLRVLVDAQACEGCGACVSTCPTSSLAFTDPPPRQLALRLRALLAPLEGRAAERPVIAFHCPEKGAAALADAGRLRWPYPASVLPVPMACLRHVAEADVLAAFGLGAAGVVLLGCDSCPHGAREHLFDRLGLVRTILEAFGLGGDRIHLITGEPREMVEAVERFASALPPSPVAWDGRDGGAGGKREVIAEAIRAFIAATGREPGRTPVPSAASFAHPDVRVGGCTVCRSCVNVCPTHAFRYRDATQTFELRQIACVNCGLCATACPESVITLKPEMFLDRGALEYQVLVQDETLRCSKCGTPFGSRRAIEVIEARVLGMAELLDTFAGARRDLLRMCPNCRAVAAVLEMQKGWEP